MKIRMTNEAKTGLLVLLCAAALLALVLKVGNFKFFQSGYTLKSTFHYTAGVKKHAPVRLSGVDVGEVKDIQVLYGDETAVELTLWLQDGVKLRKDSKAYVTTLGMMGEKYIEIKAGTPATEYAAPGDTIPGSDPIRLEEIFEKATSVADNISQMAKDISKVANNVDGTLTDNKPKIERIFDNLDETSDNFRQFSQDIKFHPWKVLAKGKEKSKEEIEKERQKYLESRQKDRAIKA